MSPPSPNSSGCRARRGSKCSWARRPVGCWSPTTRACSRSSSGSRRRAAFHSEDEARLTERKPLRVANDPSSHPMWRDEIAALRSTERLVRLAREARAQVHVLHVSTREEMEFLTAGEGRRELRGDAASPDLERRRLSAPRDEAADESAGAVGGASRGDLARPDAGRRRRASAPITRRTRSRKRRSLIPKAPRA